MLITLHLLTLPELRSLLAGTAEVAGNYVVHGSLPPDFILEQAIADLGEGRLPLWYSLFAYVAPDLGIVLGSGGFKGPPSLGRVEIGYGVADLYRGRGIATQAGRLLVRQAFAQPGVAEIYAETMITNEPSRRVLQHLGFERIGEVWTDSDGMCDRWLLARGNVVP